MKNQRTSRYLLLALLMGLSASAYSSQVFVRTSLDGSAAQNDHSGCNVCTNGQCNGTVWYQTSAGINAGGNTDVQMTDVITIAPMFSKGSVSRYAAGYKWNPTRNTTLSCSSGRIQNGGPGSIGEFNPGGDPSCSNDKKIPTTLQDAANELGILSTYYLAVCGGNSGGENAPPRFYQFSPIAGGHVNVSSVKVGDVELSSRDLGDENPTPSYSFGTPVTFEVLVDNPANARWSVVWGDASVLDTPGILHELPVSTDHTETNYLQVRDQTGAVIWQTLVAVAPLKIHMTPTPPQWINTALTPSAQFTFDEYPQNPAAPPQLLPGLQALRLFDPNPAADACVSGTAFDPAQPLVYNTLVEGKTTLHLCVKDGVGTKATADYPIWVDNTPPTNLQANVPSFLTPNSATISAEDPLSGIARMRGAWFPEGSAPSCDQILTNTNGTEAASGASLTITAVPPNSGKFVLGVCAVDTAGNRAPKVSSAVTYFADTAPPVVCFYTYRFDVPNNALGTMIYKECWDGATTTTEGAKPTGNVYKEPIAVMMQAYDAGGCSDPNASGVSIQADTNGGYVAFPVSVSPNMTITKREEGAVCAAPNNNVGDVRVHYYNVSTACANLAVGCNYQFNTTAFDLLGIGGVSGHATSKTFSFTLQMANFVARNVTAAAVPGSTTQLSYTWSAPSPTPLDIQYRLIDEGGTVVSANSISTPYTYSFASGANTRARFKLRACNAAGDTCADGLSTDSGNTTSFFTRYTLASQPDNLQVTGTVTETIISVIWGAHGNATAYTPYQVSYGPVAGPYTSKAWIKDTTDTLINLSPNSAYKIFVDAFNGNLTDCPALGCGAPGQGTQATGTAPSITLYTKPSAPGTPTWDSSTDTSIKGTINACPTTTLTPSTCYLKAINQVTNAITLAPPATPTEVTPLSPGQNYQLYACTRDNDNTRNQDVCGTPVTATTKFSAPTLSYGAAQRTATLVDQIPFQLTKSVTENPAVLCMFYTPGGDTGAGKPVTPANPALMSGLTPNSLYTLTSAQLGNSCDVADKSLSAKFIPPGGKFDVWTRSEATDMPVGQPVAGNKITATFTVPPNASGTRYELWAAPKTNDTPPAKTASAWPLKSATVTVGAASISGAINGMPYWIMVRTISDSPFTAFDDFSDIGTLDKLDNYKATDFDGVVVSPTQIVYSWTHPVPFPNDMRYQLIRVPGGTQAANNLTMPYTHTFAGGGNNHATFKLQGCNVANICEDASTKQPPNTDPTVVDLYTFANPPANLQAPTVTDSAISLTWQSNNASNTSHQLSYQTGGAGSFQPRPWVQTTTDDLTGLTSNTLYNIFVDAFNGNCTEAALCLPGQGIKAATSSPTLPVYTKPLAPTSVTWTNSTLTSISGTVNNCPDGSHCFLRATNQTTGSITDGLDDQTQITTLSAGSAYDLAACTRDNDPNRKQHMCSSTIPAATKFSAPTNLAWGAAQRNATTSDEVILQLTRNLAERTDITPILCVTRTPGGETAVSASNPISISGLASNKGYVITSAKLAAVSCDPVADKTISAPLSLSLQTWTRAEATDTPVGDPVTTGQINATFNIPTSNAAGTKYELWAFPKTGAFATTPPTVGPSTVPPYKSPTPVTTGSASIPNVINSLTYWIFVRSISDSLDTNFDAFSTPAGQTGHVRLPKPGLSVKTSAADTTETTFKATLTRDTTDPREPFSTKLTIKYDDDGTLKTFETPAIPLFGFGPTYDLIVIVPKSNTKYMQAQATISDDGLLYSLPSNPAVDVWTKAQGGPNPPLFSSATTSSITATIEFPTNNPLTTFYRLDACTGIFDDDNGTGQCLGTSIPSATFQRQAAESQRKVTIKGLTKDTGYTLRLFSISSRPSGTPAFDGWSPQAADPEIRTLLFDGMIPTSVIEYGSTTLKATWQLPFGGTGKLRIQPDRNGTPEGTSDQVDVPVTNPILTARDLTPNSKTRLTLQRDLGTGGGFTDVKLSSFTDYTNAAEPIVPGSKIITVSNPNFKVEVIPDFGNDKNEPDSEYAIEISSGDEHTVLGFLNGSGVLQSTEKWQGIAAWTPTTLTWNTPSLGATYAARVVVKQKRDQTKLYSPYRTVTMPGGVIEVTFPTISGLLMDDYLFSSGVNGSFQINFSIALENDDAAFADKITVTKLGDTTPLPLDFQYSDNDATGSHLLQVTVIGGLSPITPYTIAVKPGLKDQFGFTTSTSWTKLMVTGFDPSKRTTIYSPYDDKHTSPVVVEPDPSFGNAIIIPRTRFVNPSRAISLAPSIVDGVLNVNQGIRTTAQTEVLFYKLVNGNYVLSDSPKPVLLTLGTPTGPAAASRISSNAGASGINDSQISLYLVTSQGLQAVPGAVNNGNGTVSAYITKSGIYVLAGPVAVDLSSAYAWPVPYKPSAGHTLIHFKGLAADSKIKIYTIMGELVDELDNSASGSDEETWPVTNKDGDRVASGVYIYQIKNAYSEKRGKLMIIR